MLHSSPRTSPTWRSVWFVAQFHRLVKMMEPMPMAIDTVGNLGTGVALLRRP